MQRTVVTFGDLVVDLILSIPELPLRPNKHQMAHAMFAEPGGMGNFLIMASRLGLKPIALGTIGDDVHALAMKTSLQAEGVDTSSITVASGRQSTVAMVFISDTQEHVFLGVTGSARITGANLTEVGNKVSKADAFFTNGYVFHESDPSHLAIDAMKLAHQAGVQVYFDPGPQVQHVDRTMILDAIAQADGVFLTLEEAAALLGHMSPERVARDLLSEGPKLVAIKMGPAGCLIADSHEQTTREAFRVEVRDTAGAGDAFDAAVVYGIQCGLSLGETAALANAVGGATVSKVGTGTRLPSRAEVVGLLQRESISLSPLEE
jgi:ribokinase